MHIQKTITIAAKSKYHTTTTVTTQTVATDKMANSSAQQPATKN